MELSNSKVHDKGMAAAHNISPAGTIEGAGTGANEGLAAAPRHAPLYPLKTIDEAIQVMDKVSWVVFEPRLAEFWTLCLAFNTIAWDENSVFVKTHN
jgi:hypothetical protein